MTQYEPLIQVLCVTCYTTWPSCHVSISQGAKWHPHSHAMCHPTPRYIEKREISTVSEFDEIRRGNYISRDEFNCKVRFIIRDLENFQFSIEITVLPFFRKIEFFPGFTSMLIDPLTKGLPICVFQEHVTLMGLLGAENLCFSGSFAFSCIL